MPYGKVLVVEDDRDILLLIQQSLEEAGYQISVARTGDQGLLSIVQEKPDAVVLDIGLPGMDGLTVCREARKTQEVPILMLSSHGEDLDKILGLEVGADDYLTKPFNPRELVARVRALLRRSRRSTIQERDLLEFGGLKIDKKAHTVELGGQRIHLTPLEFSLLVALASHPGQALTREQLLDRVWGQDYFGDRRTVDVHVRHLRKKLKVQDPTDFVLAVRGVGYKFEA